MATEPKPEFETASEYAAYEKGVYDERQSQITEKENFAINFCAWYSHSPDAEIYKNQGLTAYQIMQVYKNRPYLKKDKPEEN